MGPSEGERLGAAQLRQSRRLVVATCRHHRRLPTGTRRRAAILNSRLDYAEIAERARNGEEIVVFTELATFRRLGSRRAVIDIGSQAQPFQVFIRNSTVSGSKITLWFT